MARRIGNLRAPRTVPIGRRRAPGNDISDINESGPGWATGATSPVDPEHFGRANLGMTGPNKTRFTPLNFSANLTSKLALPGNKWRNYLMFQNNSASDIFIGFGVQVASDTQNGFKISSGGFYELDRNVPFNNIYILGSLAAAQSVLVIEGIISPFE